MDPGFLGRQESLKGLYPWFGFGFLSCILACTILSISLVFWYSGIIQNLLNMTLILTVYDHTVRMFLLIKVPRERVPPAVGQSCIFLVYKLTIHTMFHYNISTYYLTNYTI